MVARLSFSAIVVLALLPSSSFAREAPTIREAIEAFGDPMLLAQRRQTCGDMRSCHEAVILWCEGYTRADGDGDGIPCETVCSTRSEVDEIRAEIGC